MNLKDGSKSQLHHTSEKPKKDRLKMRKQFSLWVEHCIEYSLSLQSQNCRASTKYVQSFHEKTHPLYFLNMLYSIYAISLEILKVFMNGASVSTKTTHNVSFVFVDP